MMHSGQRTADTVYQADRDPVTQTALLQALGPAADLFHPEVFASLPSTNTYLKENAQRLPDGAVAVAGHQTAGRGRVGRSFFSPESTGIYLSILLKRAFPPEDQGRLTTAAAVAACRAIERCTPVQPRIKWVNDVYVSGKKVCGILTEGSVCSETGISRWAVTGIGFNVYEPEGGFPQDLQSVAGSIAPERKEGLRVRLAAEFLKEFHTASADLYRRELYTEYRKHCLILGKPIFVLRGEERIPALALDLNEDFSLRVRYEDGTESALSAGEVSVRLIPG